MGGVGLAGHQGYSGDTVENFEVPPLLMGADLMVPWSWTSWFAALCLCVRFGCIFGFPNETVAPIDIESQIAAGTHATLV